jgi:competence protein ComEC
MPAWQKMLLAQLGISLMMAPLGMYWFQQASLPGFLANLVAIPVVSMLTVPLTLVSLVLMWLPGPLSSWLLTIAGYSAHWILVFLDYLTGLQPHAFSATMVPGLAVTLLAMLGAAVALLPRGVPGRFAGLLLMLPLFVPADNAAGKTETQVDFLDVGQGLSILLATRDYLLVYDTGPGNGLEGDAGSDLVAGTIQPMIRATGKIPDMVIASHADLDHAGGLETLRSTYPNAVYLANLRTARPGISACSKPAAWQAGHLGFRVIHPSPSLPYLGNDSSCVISVNGPGLSLLLSGDISRVVEQRLVDEGLSQHAILSAPHHGSSSSSSQALLDAVRPSWVLISSAAGNRFGFPRPDVLERYAKAHIPNLNTALCGGIRITSDGRGVFGIKSARVSRNAIWRWPAIKECP